MGMNSRRRLLRILIIFFASAMSIAVRSMDAAVSSRAPAVHIAEIVGAAYRPASNQFLLYAVEGDEHSGVEITTDDLRRIARAVFEVGNFAFSLEPERDGSRASDFGDLADPERLVGRLRDPEDSLAIYLRSLMSPDTLKLLDRDHVMAGQMKELRSGLIAGLNRARKDHILYDQERFYGYEISPDTQALLKTTEDSEDVLRRNRLLLEDALASLLANDFGRRMRIRYLPAQHETVLRSIFAGSGVERTFLTMDRVLKELSQRPESLAYGLRLGPSELLLCSREFESWVRSGREVEAYARNPYVTYYDMSATYVFDTFDDRLGVRFEKARVLVKTASRTDGTSAPECVQRFVQNLTANIDQLERSREIGAEFRRLKNLILLTKVMGFARQVFVPINPEALKLSVEVAPHQQPPDIMENWITVADPNGTPHALLVRGGILLAEGSYFAFPEAEPRLAPPTQEQSSSGSPATEKPGGRRGEGGDSGFVVAPDYRYGRNVWSIDISSILGIGRR